MLFKGVINMKKTTIDIFVPCYNASRFLRQCLDSLLNQTYRDLRIVLLDDGSTDESLEIAESISRKDSRLVIYKNSKNMGVSYTRNRGLQLCQADYIAFMDADDIAPLSRIETEKEFLDHNPYIDGVGGYYQIIDEDGIKGQITKLEPHEPEKLRKTMIFKNIIANGSAMIRKNTINGDLEYPENYAGLEDYFYWINYLKYNSFYNIPEIMQFYRVNSNGLSQTNNGDSDKLKHRNTCFDKIHEISFSYEGFCLSDTDKDILFRCFRDRSYLSTIDEKKKCKELCDGFRKHGYII